MKKIFKLSSSQEIEIPNSHPIYNDVLAAVLVNQDINSIISDTLMTLGYNQSVSVGGKMHWYIKSSLQFISPIILRGNK